MDILVLMDALQHFFEYEETTIIKNLKNKTIREMNWEVANETKTLNTGNYQIKMIKYIGEKIGLNSLSPVLEEAAFLRLNNPEDSLQSLADKINISKSGIRNRFRRIEEVYNSLLEEEKNSAVSFNIALCYLKAQKYETVLFYLEKALAEIRRNRSIEISKDNYPELLTFEEENDAYTKPMLYLTPLQFPDLAREQILRLMVDILFILEKKEDMYKIINSLKNKNYKNVKDKIKGVENL